MSDDKAGKPFTFERFDLRACACDECDEPVRERSEFDGAWVRAEDAINREAVNAAAIRTLEASLKEARAAHAMDKARLDSGRIMTHERDEFGDEYQCDRRGIDLRAGIDAAIEAAKHEPKREPPRFASEFMDRFLSVSILDLWAALETVAPSGGYWKRNKDSLAYDWERGDPLLSGLTLDAIQAALP